MLISNVFFKLATINAALFTLLTKHPMLFAFRPIKLSVFLYVNNKCLCQQKKVLLSLKLEAFFCEKGSAAYGMSLR